MVEIIPKKKEISAQHFLIYFFENGSQNPRHQTVPTAGE